MNMIKQIGASFIGAFLAFGLVAGISYFSVTNYIEGKIAVLDRVEALVNVSSEKIDKIFLTFENGIGNVDDAVTNSKVYQRIFGDDE